VPPQCKPLLALQVDRLVRVGVGGERVESRVDTGELGDAGSAEQGCQDLECKRIRERAERGEDQQLHLEQLQQQVELGIGQ